MKNLFKIIFCICMVLLLPSLASGNYINIRSFKTQQDTTNLNNQIRVDSFPLPIVPPASGVQFFRNKIIFLSLTKNERKMSADQISFGSVDAYYASILDSVTGKHYLFSQSHPFSYPAEAVTFNLSYDTIYFTNLADDGKEKIFMAKYSDVVKPGITDVILPLEFCKGLYNYSHPTLSADGNTMIFASDKEGTLGGMDLFISRRISHRWTTPENIGSLINTPGDEFFPFLDQDNNLFFSSNGLKGFGGYDIFTSKFNGKGWDKPVNLSNTINSKYDDIAFTMNSVDGKSAFFTRRSGNNEMQLFRITTKQENNNLLSALNGKTAPKSLIAVVTKEEKSQPSVDAQEITKPVATPEEKTVKKSTTINTGAKSTSQKAATAKEPPAQTSDNKYTAIKPVLPVYGSQKDIVVFRVQITTSQKPMKEKEIVLNNKTYPLFEYYYLGAYRYCIGEFTTLHSAAELQNICRKSGYPQAFAVAFKNDTRLLDLKSFK